MVVVASLLQPLDLKVMAHVALFLSGWKKKQRGWSAALRLGNLFEFELYLHLTLVLTDELQVHTNLSTLIQHVKGATSSTVAELH